MSEIRDMCNKGPLKRLVMQEYSLSSKNRRADPTKSEHSSFPLARSRIGYVRNPSTLGLGSYFQERVPLNVA